ncbi:hypothetical protein BJX96DRAFT_176103 [Aspergillus floccosus]
MSQNAISCEPCRQKKCKCDRILPTCSQCATAPSRCIYPESGKRGLPQGYITHLEHRLIDTELALYTLYSQLRRAGLHTETPDVHIPPTVPERLARQSRTPNMAEWERLPLRDARDWERWWAGKRVLFGEDGPDTSQTGEQSPREGTETRERDTAPAQGDSIGGLQGKAEELARAESNTYF